MADFDIRCVEASGSTTREAVSCSFSSVKGNNLSTDEFKTTTFYFSSVDMLKIKQLQAARSKIQIQAPSKGTAYSFSRFYVARSSKQWREVHALHETSEQMIVLQYMKFLLQCLQI